MCAGVFHQPSAAESGVPEGAADAITPRAVSGGVCVRQTADPEWAGGLAPAQPMVSLNMSPLGFFSDLHFTI